MHLRNSSTKSRRFYFRVVVRLLTRNYFIALFGMCQKLRDPMCVLCNEQHRKHAEFTRIMFHEKPFTTSKNMTINTARRPPLRLQHFLLFTQITLSKWPLLEAYLCEIGIDQK